MVSVASLLNPIKDEKQQLINDVPTRRVLSVKSSTPEFSLLPPCKKRRTLKDAPIFTKGKINGEIRYPPWEVYSNTVIAELQMFSIYPLGHISHFRRHIPYNSDKKDFMAKTGRDGFEVFQYTFRPPYEDRDYTVMWDYNIGLTMPARMLNSNPGLKDISHSITGGALAAQGYWMPFEAAEAVAATFCWDIRFALVPIFGPSFVTKCVKRGEEGYGCMVIDAAITHRCAVKCREYKEAVSHNVHQTPDSPLVTSSSIAPKQSLGISGGDKRQSLEVEKSFCSSKDQYEQSLKHTDPKTLCASPQRAQLSDRLALLSLPSTEKMCRANQYGRNFLPDSPDSSRSSDLTSSITRHQQVKQSDTGIALLSQVNCSMTPSQDSLPPLRALKETKAAYALMQLHLADTSISEAKLNSRKRRASS